MLLQLDSTVSYASGREGDVFTTTGRAQLRLALQHLQGSRPATRAHRLCPARRPSRRRSTRPTATGSTSSRSTSRPARRCSPTPRPSTTRRSRSSRSTAGPRTTRSADALRRPGLTDRPLAVAGHASGRLRGAGLDWTYEAVEVEEDGLEPFLSALGDDVRGFSVTAPLKRRTAALVGEASEIVGRLGRGQHDPGRGRRPAQPTTPTSRVRWRRCSNAESSGLARRASSAAVRPQPRWRTRCRRIGAERVEFVVRDPSRAAEAAQVAKAAGLAVTVHTIDEPLIDKRRPADLDGARLRSSGHGRMSSSTPRGPCSTSSTTRGPHRWPRPPSRPAYASCPDSTCWRTRPRCRWSS